MNYLTYIPLLVMLTIFTGCGGGGNDSTPAQTLSDVTGVFIDDAVEGLGYSCSSGITGTTNSNGEYTCSEGDNVTFFINGVQIGTASVQTTAITPYSLFPNDNIAALNLARLLQSLNKGTVVGKIVIDTTQENNVPLDTNFSSSDFETDMETAFGSALVSLAEAQDTMNSAIVSAGGTLPSDLNHVPVADAGSNQDINTTTVVTLDASASSDADLDTLTYTWTITQKPSSSTVILSNTAAVNPTFIADVDGMYIFSLVVNDGNFNSISDTVTVSALTANRIPVANAGVDQNVYTTVVVALDASGSSDADSDTLTYTWTLTSKPDFSTATLSDVTVINPTFTADMEGTYVFSLLVNDGTDNSNTSSVTINALRANTAPVADAGLDQNVSTTAIVTLDASGSSDADADNLTYYWTPTSKPNSSTATLSDVTLLNPTFTADVEGSYVFSLVVNDGTDNSSPSRVTINALRVNTAPVADAGDDQTIDTGSWIFLDALASSDADLDTLTYLWSITSKPEASTETISDATDAHPTFTADADGLYIFSLVVNDGKVDSISDSMTLIASSAPISDAGVDQNVNTTSVVTLDGSSSHALDYGDLTYQWSLTSQPDTSTASLSDVTVVNPTFTAEIEGTYLFTLVVNDGTFDSTSDSVTINVATASSVDLATVPHTKSSIPMLGILVNYNNQEISSDDTVWSNKLFGKNESQLNHYYQEVSGGYFEYLKATENSGINNDGIVSIHLNKNHPDASDLSVIYPDLKEALLAINDSAVDFSSYDLNGDALITPDELILTFIIAGYEDSYEGTHVTNGIWAHQYCMTSSTNSPTLDGVSLMDCQNGGNFALFGERHDIAHPHDATIGIIAHELGHATFNLPDLYNTVNVNSGGIGYFGLMGSGAWAQQNSVEYAGNTPVHFTAWSKIYNGWITPTISDENVTLNETFSSDYNVLKIRIDATSYYLLENRNNSGYDRGLYSLPGSFNGGMALWKIDETKLTQEYFENNSVNADTNNKGVDLVEAQVGNIDSTGGGGDEDALYYEGNKNSFSTLITDISQRGSSMSLNIN